MKVISMAWALASNCVVVVERALFVFIFGPTLSPPPLSRPAGRERGANSQFGRVFKALQCLIDRLLAGFSLLGRSRLGDRKYLNLAAVGICHCGLDPQSSIGESGNWGLTPISLAGQVRHARGSAAVTWVSISACLPSGYFFALKTRPNWAVGSPLPPGGAGEGRGGVSGAKKGKNRSASATPMPLKGRNNWNLTPIKGSFAL